MAFKEVMDLSTDTVIAIDGRVDKKTKVKSPTSVEGFYLGSREVNTKKGKAFIHTFSTPKGNVGVWGKTDLNRKLQQVTPGSMTRAELAGKVDTPNGEMYKFKVATDPEQSIEVNLAPANTPIAQDDDDTSYSPKYSQSRLSDDEDESEDYLSEETEDAASASAKRRAEVENMLKNRMKK